jgi:hypothetical protein
MKRLLLIGALILVSCLVFVVSLFSIPWRGKDMDVRKAKSPEGNTAVIVGFADGFSFVSADLVVRSSNQTVLFRTNLIRKRDSIADIEAEFIGVRIDGNTVTIDAKTDWYSGPKTITF